MAAPSFAWELVPPGKLAGLTSGADRQTCDSAESDTGLAGTEAEWARLRQRQTADEDELDIAAKASSSVLQGGSSAMTKRQRSEGGDGRAVAESYAATPTDAAAKACS